LLRIDNYEQLIPDIIRSRRILARAPWHGLPIQSCARVVLRVPGQSRRLWL